MRSKRAGWGAAVAVVAGLVLAAAGARPAAADFPVTDFIHIALNGYWHYVHYTQFARQIYQNYESLANEVKQIDNQLVALRKLEHPNWREVYDLLANLDWIMRQGQALAYSYKTIDAQFQQVFPGFAPVTDWPVQRQQQAVRTLDTMRTGLDTVSEQSRHDIADQLFLEGIKTQVGGIQGHEQALELLSTIDIYTAQELGVIKQSLATANNLHAVYYAHQINREAEGEATLVAALQRTIAGASGEGAPGYGAIPSWWPFF